MVKEEKLGAGYVGCCTNFNKKGYWLIQLRKQTEPVNWYSQRLQGEEYST